MAERKSWLPTLDPEGTCLVTGASAGIGAAIAREFASRGYGVTLVARREERLEALARDLATAHSIRAEALPCDLADAEARDALPGQVEALGLRVDILVNDAGLGTYGDFVASDRRRQVEQVRVMCEAVVGLSSSFTPQMASSRRGAMLIVSSSLAFVPMARYATYCGTRAFCLALANPSMPSFAISGSR